jgi:transposase InsO family protein
MEVEIFNERAPTSLDRTSSKMIYAVIVDRYADPRSDDLVRRQFRPDGPDRLWVRGVTQHHQYEGLVYLAVVIDAWIRPVVDWSIADLMHADLVADAIDMATLRHRPAGSTFAHGNHGWNYCSGVFGQRLRRADTPDRYDCLRPPWHSGAWTSPESPQPWPAQRSSSATSSARACG